MLRLIQNLSAVLLAFLLLSHPATASMMGTSTALFSNQALALQNASQRHDMLDPTHPTTFIPFILQFTIVSPSAIDHVISIVMKLRAHGIHVPVECVAPILEFLDPARFTPVYELLASRNIRFAHQPLFKDNPKTRRIYILAADTMDSADEFQMVSDDDNWIFPIQSGKLTDKDVEAELRAQWRQALHLQEGVPVITLASVSEEEAEPMAQLTRDILKSAPGKVRVAFVPRNIQHRSFWENHLKGLPYAIRVQKEDGIEIIGDPKSPIWLILTWGELRNIQSVSEITVMGNTILNGLGHNMGEPASVGSITLMGKYWGPNDFIAKMVLDSGGGVLVEDFTELRRIVLQLISDPVQLRKAKDHAQQAAVIFRDVIGAIKNSRIERSFNALLRMLQDVLARVSDSEQTLKPTSA